eukprot:CAMPEP_0174743898 /NCGR_PEP_ID=MMETSP1094-20130205/82819_1 /TAXON_ID=156173 /ORGANISM="Chrysochromulina brevifilum, Strain UTEX LB 985" /LENGTH=102 /DNA_ID=CAMNT_0015948185 /DNA_START=71 /DNA_END=380 /DNA_ORIENTATION=-
MDRFRAVVRALGIAGSEAEHDAIFAEWDADQSGELDFKEVRMALKALQSTSVIGTPDVLLGHEAFLQKLEASEGWFGAAASLGPARGVLTGGEGQRRAGASM